MRRRAQPRQLFALRIRVDCAPHRVPGDRFDGGGGILSVSFQTLWGSPYADERLNASNSRLQPAHRLRREDSMERRGAAP